MTRREWLAKNPPPKAAGTLRDLLERLTQEQQTRGLLEANRATFQQHVNYWTQEIQSARQANDTAKLTSATAQLQDFQNKITEIDRQLTVTATLSQRIAELKNELAKAARCPSHQTDLVRHKNRPDDLFLCEVGPHFFLWSREGNAARLVPVDLSKSLPGIDEQMDTNDKVAWV